MAIGPKLYSIYLARVGFLESNSFKIRPVIVVSKPRGPFKTFIAIPISTQARKTDVDVSIDDILGTGLHKPSIARVHRLSATASTQLLEEIGTVDETHQKAIEIALKQLLDIK